MSSRRREIEDAVVELLTTLRPRGLRLARAWNGLVTPDDLDDIKNVTKGIGPAALVSAAGRTYRTLAQSRRRSVGEQTIEITLTAPSLRSREENIRDDIPGASPGAWALMEMIQEVLIGRELELDGARVQGVGLLSPVSEDVIAKLEQVSIWRVLYNAEVDVAQGKRYPAGTQPLTSIVSRIQPPEAEALLAAGTGDAFTKVGNVMTLAEGSGPFLPEHVGERIRIAGAASAENNGTFTITAVPSAIECQFTNAAGHAEAFTGTWAITPQPFVVARAGSP